MSNRFLAMELLLIFIAPQGLVDAQTRPSSQTRQSVSRQKPSEELAKSVGPVTPREAERRVTNRETQRIELGRGDAKNFYRLAVKYANIGMYDEAIRALGFATKLKPAYTDAYFVLGEIYADLHRWTDAIEAYKRFLQLDPKDDEAHLRLEDAYAKLRAMQRTGPLTEERGTKNDISTGSKVTLDLSVPK